MKKEHFAICPGLAVSLCVVMALASVCHAVVGGTEDIGQFDDPGSQWYGMTLDWIGRTGAGSAVAVGNRWFLSAAHLSVGVGRQIELPGGGVYTVSEVYNAPVIGFAPADLTVIRVAEELPGWYDIYVGAYAPGASVIMAGTGCSGAVDPVNDTFNWSAGTARTWRWGTNEVSRALWTPSGPYCSLCLQMDFDYGDTVYEAGWGNGDSGGGAFLYDDGEWRLAGIGAYIGMNGGGSSPPYNVSSSVHMPAYVDWIQSIIPTGDLNDDDVIDAEDIDLLFAYIDGAVGDGDLDSDGVVDIGDMDFLIRSILGTEYGDFDLNGVVDIADLTILASHYELSGAGWAGGDANGSGVVDSTDLTILATYFDFDGEIPLTPEPTSMSLFGAAALLSLRKRRKSRRG